MQYHIENFGSVKGHKVHLITLTCVSGQKIQITNYGGIVHAWYCIDNNNLYRDVLLGCTDLHGYQQRHPYFGAIIGRYANRIAYGKFKIHHKEYHLNCNLPPHHLHGGLAGFDTKIWDFDVSIVGKCAVISFTSESLDMDEGYPGHMLLKITYTFTEENELIINYHATTDKPTIINLTNHCYFNLSGDADSDINDHEVMIHADVVTDTDDNLIPTGKWLDISGTPLDLRNFYSLENGITSDFDAIKKANGYDHNYVINLEDRSKPVAIAKHPRTGRRLQVFTDQPGIQFYTGNWLNNVSGKTGKYKEYSGFCLETQHFPDSPNNDNFPSTLLLPGQIYATTTKYKIDVIY